MNSRLRNKIKEILKLLNEDESITNTTTNVGNINIPVNSGELHQRFKKIRKLHERFIQK